MHTTRARIAAGALTAAVVVGLTSCASAGGGAPARGGGFEGRGPINYVAGKDVSGTFRGVVDQWNREHPDEKVTFVELPEQSDQQRQQHIQNAQTRSDANAVIALDVVWTAEFAANRWIEPLPEEQFPLDQTLPPVVEGAKYRGVLYAAPAWADGGLLFYRTDLLAEAGIDKPPTTWARLRSQCGQVLALPNAAGMSCYAGQFEKYEGLTVNFAEAVQSAGGAIVDENGKPTVDTPQAKRGLDFLVDGFKSGLIPRPAITFQEEQGRQAFQKGQLVFHRQWPYQHALASKTDGSSAVAGKFDVAPLPGADGPGSSSLGGWNLAVSSFAKNKATALDFVKYMTSAQRQRQNLEAASLAPTYTSLYDDPELVRAFPYLPTLKASIMTAQPRPRVVRYGDAAGAIQDEAYAALTGVKSSEAALADLQGRLDKITGGR
ncbi:ABC transporter substrate-binding protein [Actinokineospora iranica]|uniref:Carbohydrate ABC transporter substrate-binding protein, CUT1 family n=1 Tax=Actinokineospora iranica TaxID=1271860 RepID=A0A1G6S9E8_9PSEU|nr:ABC transporter substrate-binding protein [Actinokineospora iranica]SDD13542.1 carbohydrate ABC transporter substrate-binding protein, CUT1 family [Actinokineospora iranica]